MNISPEDADATYAEVVKEDFAIKADGNTIEGTTGFQVDMVAEVSKVNVERQLPVFKAELKDGSVKTIIPVRGKGLWGPIWGFVALDEDLNTIYGTSFDHKGETPGLGADINQPFFEDQFKGKKLFDGDTFKLLVYKGGGGAAANAGDLVHGVDAISGGTITSKGLEDMLKDCLSPYQSYFKNNKK
jgi:Na+-transporting NADH:ubiquinone oxidoreductase subunit C